MRRFVDYVRTTDMSLAYAIAEALEKNEKYSVDLVENQVHNMDCGHHHTDIELRVYLNEKVTSPTIGYCNDIDITANGAEGDSHGC